MTISASHRPGIAGRPPAAPDRPGGETVPAAAPVVEDRQVEPLSLVLRASAAMPGCSVRCWNASPRTPSACWTARERLAGRRQRGGGVAVLHSSRAAPAPWVPAPGRARRRGRRTRGKAGEGVPTEVAMELTTLRQLLDEALVELRGALAEVLPPPVIAENHTYNRNRHPGRLACTPGRTRSVAQPGQSRRP